MTGHGGWPMTVFTTPDGRPFFAEDVLRDRRGEMLGFVELCEQVGELLHASDDLVDQARQLTGALGGGRQCSRPPTVCRRGRKSTARSDRSSPTTTTCGVGSAGPRSSRRRWPRRRCGGLPRRRRPRPAGGHHVARPCGLRRHLRPCRGGFARYSVDGQ